MNPALLREYTDLYKSLADETRLIILALLLRYGELCVCDIEAVLEISQSKASRHLRYLKHAGLLDDRREGVWVHYQIADPATPTAARVLEANRELIVSLPDEGLERRLAERLAAKERDDICC